MLKSLAASFALTKSAGGLTVYWSGEWRDPYGMRPVFVDLGGPAVARFEFKHQRGDGGYDTVRSDVLSSYAVGGIATDRPLLAVRVALRHADGPGWCTKWIHNPYS